MSLQFGNSCMLELPNTDVYEIELVLYFTRNVNVINISYSRSPGLPVGVDVYL